MYSFTIFSFFVDDLVKGLLSLALSATYGKEKSNLLPFEPVALVDGVSNDFGAGLGETSLYGN